MEWNLDQMYVSLGNCGPDGYYYGDATHFVQCIGGKSYEMQCAPGTENR